MKKLLHSILFIVTLVANPMHADTNTTKDTNKTMANDEFMKEFMRLDKNIEIKRKKTEELKKQNKTLDEILDLLDTKKSK
jgi:hypothetical protein